MSLEAWEQEHNGYLREINTIPLETPANVAKAQYLYCKARISAFKIAGYYKASYKKHEARAEITQGAAYAKIRRGEVEKYADLKTANDAQYLSRINKGNELEAAAEYEGLYITWAGIAQSYQDAINSLKDLLKTMMAENGG